MDGETMLSYHETAPTNARKDKAGERIAAVRIRGIWIVLMANVVDVYS